MLLECVGALPSPFPLHFPRSIRTPGSPAVPPQHPGPNSCHGDVRALCNWPEGWLESRVGSEDRHWRGERGGDSSFLPPLLGGSFVVSYLLLPLADTKTFSLFAVEEGMLFVINHA